MVVLHVADFTLKHKSGIGEVVLILTRLQAELGWQPYVLLVNSPPIEAADDNGHIASFHEIADIEGYLKKVKADIVVFHSFYKKAYMKLQPLLVKMQVPYLIQPHAAFSKKSQEKGRIKKIVANLFFFKAFVKKSCGIIYLNQAEKDTSVFWHRHEFMLPNGIDINVPLIADKQPEDPLKLIFLSRIDVPHKGLDLLLACLHEAEEALLARNICIRLYGWGKEQDVDFVKQQLANLKLDIRLEDGIFGEAKTALLRKSDIFLLTSRYEGLPMAILEALSFGMPCFITAETNMANLITDFDAGWITRLDTIAMGQKLIEAIDDYRTNYPILRRNARRAVEQGFDWKEIAIKSIAIYRQVLHSSQQLQAAE